MYDPVRDGVPKSTAVTYAEMPPPARLRDVVHCFWQLRTEADLDDDFSLHALPDACVNLLFDQQDPRIAGVTQLHTRHTVLDLGKSFDYAGIQLFPGVWRGPDTPVDHYVGEPYAGDLPLVEIGQAAAALGLDDKAPLFADLVDTLLEAGVVAPNPVTAAILTNLDEISSVGDMATVAALSPRQLQRVVKATTGLAPHDLLKVLRLQHSMRHDYRRWYADQSHYTHEFRKLTGYTPRRFRSSFDV
jgi:hypothetical protein